MVTSFSRVPLLSSAQWSTAPLHFSPSQVQMFLRNNQEGRNTSICGETMEESDEEEEDGGAEEDQRRGQMKEEGDEEEEDRGGEEDQRRGDAEAAAVQQSCGAEQTECSGSSAALASDPSTAHTAPPAGQLPPLEGPDSSMNGGDDGEQWPMFGFLHQRNVKTRDEAVPVPVWGIGTDTRVEVLYSYT